jgi:hypothetical protein
VPVYKEIFIIAVYVDDILLAVKNEQQLAEAKRSLAGQLKMASSNTFSG